MAEILQHFGKSAFITKAHDRKLFGARGSGGGGRVVPKCARAGQPRFVVAEVGGAPNPNLVNCPVVSQSASVSAVFGQHFVVIRPIGHMAGGTVRVIPASEEAAVGVLKAVLLHGVIINLDPLVDLIVNVIVAGAFDVRGKLCL